MTNTMQATQYQADPVILTLGSAFYDPVTPAIFPNAITRFRNDRWAGAIGLGALSEAEWIAHFAGFEPLPDNLTEPLALRYHGHQFRVYNPEIGDGRGFLFAQIRDGESRLLDLGTKGSGQTPYSRFGDGRLTLKGGVREVLATEMLEALGVDTSKSFSLIETGEALERNDEPSPTRSAVLVRLQHSHIRIGTFQRFAYFGERENLARLVDYCLAHYYGEEGGDDGPQRLLAHVAIRTARLAASYIAAGFVHGVLNTDNIAITGQSFDYGPWRWTPFWDPTFTAAYFDQGGLYAFGRQPEAIQWDLFQLSQSLTLLVEPEGLNEPLKSFVPLFQNELEKAILRRLGVKARGTAHDRDLVRAIERALLPQTVMIDRFFFDWRGGRRRAPSPAETAYENEAFKDLAKRLSEYEPDAVLDDEYWSDADPCSMHIDEVEAIWERIDKQDDWSAFNEKIAMVRRMGKAMD